jgi:hypothetical protein
MKSEQAIQDPLLAGDQQYKTYPARWWMLIIFSILSITNAMMWITFAPISDDTSDYFGGPVFHNTNDTLIALSS